ncbi:hypothetical protein DRP53_06070 [candidate division WOR-3 bacterium]|uniref:Tetratricopeptide repeat protein n=1 Tax=candidate division WOR-3 bacterium TaxID=2052148 RepID=A0A660SJH0_UNCW3|nr:MAG: hypothetical protein DRP53_06070 [candidate division WOR-3 bacterium]
MNFRNLFWGCSLFIIVALLANLCFINKGAVELSYDHRADDLLDSGLIAIRKGRLEDAELRLRHALTLEPGYAANYYYLGEIFIQRKRWDSACYYFTRAIEIDPEAYSAYYKLGIAFKRKGNYKNAIKYLKRAIQLNPGFAVAYGALRDIFITIGNYEAVVEIDRILERMIR